LSLDANPADGLPIIYEDDDQLLSSAASFKSLKLPKGSPEEEMIVDGLRGVCDSISFDHDPRVVLRAAAYLKKSHVFLLVFSSTTPTQAVLWLSTIFQLLPSCVHEIENNIVPGLGTIVQELNESRRELRHLGNMQIKLSTVLSWCGVPVSTALVGLAAAISSPEARPPIGVIARATNVSETQLSERLKAFTSAARKKVQDVLRRARDKEEAGDAQDMTTIDSSTANIGELTDETATLGTMNAAKSKELADATKVPSDPTLGPSTPTRDEGKGTPLPESEEVSSSFKRRHETPSVASSSDSPAMKTPLKKAQPHSRVHT